MTDTHAKIARDKLHATLKASYARTLACGTTLAKVAARANNEPDLVAHYSATARVIVALEELKGVAEQAAKDLRGALLLSMLDTGCPQVADEANTVYLAREPAFLEVIDPAGIPPDLWTRPKPEPDKKAIRAAMDQGRPVPGASINIRNSQRLMIRGKN
jgi:hypothetical protein